MEASQAGEIEEQKGEQKFVLFFFHFFCFCFCFFFSCFFFHVFFMFFFLKNVFHVFLHVVVVGDKGWGCERCFSLLVWGWWLCTEVYVAWVKVFGGSKAGYLGLFNETEEVRTGVGGVGWV